MFTLFSLPSYFQIKLCRKLFSSSLLLSAISSAVFTSASIAYEIDPDATISDSSASLMGVNHIALSVRDLDASLEFYQKASGFKLVRREVVRSNSAADKLYGREGVEYEVAVLEAPNMLFELTEFSHNRDIPISKMPVEGPGMTHTCFQSPAHLSGYDKFKNAGAEMLSRGDGPVDLLGQGVTYAYAYDPEGNMVELEQLDFDKLGGDRRSPEWIEQGLDLWMTQVALVTHDIERLTNYYSEIMGFNPYRAADIAGRPTFDDATAIDDVSLKVVFFRMAQRSKSMEFWEYVNPKTPEFSGNRDSTALGYSYSMEVGDIQAEYTRMTDLGVEFVSEPVLLGNYWQVNANDIDGNVFALRQWVDSNSPWSVPNLEL
ncbi:MAG: catechol 2,3-dioxygenase-like lactoylglutathione lyase family enzyme [Pseudohongiellaceae bacterium]|jgi:catechol 2,3-dioxygenase-like lactoylglutathione lyase family enzyme